METILSILVGSSIGVLIIILYNVFRVKELQLKKNLINGLIRQQVYNPHDPFVKDLGSNAGYKEIYREGFERGKIESAEIVERFICL